ncbi:phospholipase C/P1 nuclease family protein [Agrilutibacter solisilvae]|uniref:Phospholipase n=1 Tax=Agrilutibacter solisilvae TaxID=2763317 RepID=A0A974XX96_9GAMM|nr:hypothetical protein [Lysobacter solisilvae]QSX77507.1 hypothetical protein I8J32_012175 [Lysobacter solisilvae]
MTSLGPASSETFISNADQKEANMRVSGVMGLSLVLALGMVNDANAWSKETHRRIVLDALQYMKNNPTKTQYNKLATWAKSAGVSFEQLATVIAQSAADVDDFADTYLCGAVSGDCQRAPAWSAATDIAHYTRYWHFQNHTRGPDLHGNDFGGYDYGRLTQYGDVDELAAGWLWNDHLDDGQGGMGGLLGDGSKYNTYSTTEARYRIGTASTKSMYADYQSMPFQPIDNLGQAWWTSFREHPTAQTLGYALHTTDLLQPHHTWTTLGKNHSGWEQWVNDYYYSLSLNNPTLVTAALSDGTFNKKCTSSSTSDVRGLLTEGGAYSYRVGGAVLSSTDHSTRLSIAQKTVPRAIAMTVLVLDCAALHVTKS